MLITRLNTPFVRINCYLEMVRYCTSLLLIEVSISV